ncbi:MAG: DMT family transporter [Verrucomicrobiae bacterium]|nr:DMT family transporter [Verrucomicrobiae bacterium]
MQTDVRGWAALIGGAVCIGFAPIWVRWSEVGPIATAFHRVALALPLLVLWAARERSRPAATRHSNPRRPGWAFAAGAFFAIDMAAWHLSIRYTSVANSTLLANLAPIFVTLGAWIFLRERVGRRFTAGMILALLGAWCLTGASLQTDPNRLRGDLWGLATALFYGGYQLCVARLRRDTAAGRVLFWSSLVSAPLLGIIAWSLGETMLPASPRGWLVLLGLALTAQVFGQGLITYGFAHLPASLSSLVLLLQPLVATLAAWMLLGERLGIAQLLGGAILLAGIQVARSRPAPPAPSSQFPDRPLRSPP